MNYNYLEKYINRLQGEGRYTFTLPELEKQFPREKTALHMALKRLADKNQVARIRKGFYVIVPAEYRRRGILPPLLFIDDLMRHLDRPYYVALLSAAALHGAAHQQPQELQVVTNPPAMRPVQTRGTIIRFMLKKDFPRAGIMQKKTDTGYASLSNPEMTALDLLQFQRRSGGLERVLEVLQELAEKFNPTGLEDALQNQWPAVILQRFGYLCRHRLQAAELIPILQRAMAGGKIHAERLDPSEPSRAGTIDKEWMIINNISLGI